jgi:hypothetical protein
MCGRISEMQRTWRIKYQDEMGVKLKNTPVREADIIQSKRYLKEQLTFRWFKTSPNIKQDDQSI